MLSEPAATSRAADAAGHLVLALDQGTTNTKALLLDPATGVTHARATRPVGISHPQPGWAEQDAEELWQATRAALVEVLGAGQAPAAIALSNQRETVVAWNRTTGEPLGPALGWQDARTADRCARLAAQPGVATLVRERTGLSLDPMFSASKMRYLLDAAQASGTATAEVCVGTVDAWIVWRLTGRHLTEVGNASRTLLLDLRSRAWDAELLDLFGVPLAVLPEVRDSDAGFGLTTGDGEVPAGVPVVAVLADSHAALYHHGGGRPGAGKATYGTGSSVMIPIGTTASDGTTTSGTTTSGTTVTAAPDGIATTVAWSTAAGPTYAREGNIVASGAALDWMARTLGAPEGTSGGAYLTDLAGSVPDAGGVCFVPAFSGLGAPYWDRGATGILTGVGAGTTRAHLARAALEAVAHQVADVVEAVESDGRAQVGQMHADGGASASPLLMQIQADLLRRDVLVSAEPEASARGVAILAARTLGLPVADPAPGALVRPRGTDPSTERDAWRAAVTRSRGQAIPSTQHPNPDRS